MRRIVRGKAHVMARDCLFGGKVQPSNGRGLVSDVPVGEQRAQTAREFIKH